MSSHPRPLPRGTVLGGLRILGTLSAGPHHHRYQAFDPAREACCRLTVWSPTDPAAACGTIPPGEDALRGAVEARLALTHDVLESVAGPIAAGDGWGLHSAASSAARPLHREVPALLRRDARALERALTRVLEALGAVHRAGLGFGGLVAEQFAWDEDAGVRLVDLPLPRPAAAATPVAHAPADPRRADLLGAVECFEELLRLQECAGAGPDPARGRLAATLARLRDPAVASAALLVPDAAPAAAAPPEEAPAAGPEGALAVLVVDDDPFFRELLAEQLRALPGIRFRGAGDGAEALELLRAEAADLVLCDLQMPGMDGIQFLRHLAQQDFPGALALVSGGDRRVLQTAEGLARAHDLHVVDRVRKPVRPQVLAAMVASVRRRRAAPGRRGLVPLTEGELRAGLATGEPVEVFYQPKVAVDDGRLVGVEALVRWRHPERGLLGPGAFVPLAEERGGMDRLTDLVLERAVADAAGWHRSGRPIGVSVNVAAGSLTRLELPERIAALVESCGLPAGALTLEVTETSLMEDLRGSAEVLTRLRMRDLHVSIDDFGTGYSTLSQLRSLPFDELKIDRAFVFGAPEDREMRAVLGAIVDLGLRLELGIVAEGVETRSEWDLVTELGCHTVQGYHVARPMPLADLEAWMDVRPGRAAGDGR